ncbi:MAG: hypothetical protein ACRDJ9_16645 [Dehalococcoidia bacterium]
MSRTNIESDDDLVAERRDPGACRCCTKTPDYDVIAEIAPLRAPKL